MPLCTVTVKLGLPAPAKVPLIAPRSLAPLRVTNFAFPENENPDVVCVTHASNE